ncbi:hypothetical protein Sjap_018196 [Stephania japonica]|uniref:Uncharacterized protein n=1 Tax=Stephania japonica TaxID=461633 RepID=A0AAP0I7I4_9MAGN
MKPMTRQNQNRKLKNKRLQLHRQSHFYKQINLQLSNMILVKIRVQKFPRGKWHCYTL